MPRCLALTACLLSAAVSARGDDGPPTVPATRVELKQALDASKHQTPRLPLPPLSAADRTRMADAQWTGADWSVFNNGRTRLFYLPPELAQVSSLRADDPVMSLGHRCQTMLFWLVSRANNCTYCLGHQESKLAAAGMTDDQVAALDGDWSEFTPRERAAFTLTRKLTDQPDRLGPDDITAARQFYTAAQVLEIVHAVANFNAMNRWTGALLIPQEEHRVYLTPTAERYLALVSRQAPLDPAPISAGRAKPRVAHRAPLESRAEVEARLTGCQTRTPTLPLVEDAAARVVLARAESTQPLPAWVRLLATFPKAGPARVALHDATATAGQLDLTLRAQIAWIAARHDRAWYALGHARDRLHALGQSDDAIFSLDDPTAAGSPSPAQQAVFALARKLTVNPALVADADIARLRDHFADREVAEIIFQITEAAYFDRLTEAAQLPLEPGP